jgi:hypothetical protein
MKGGALNARPLAFYKAKTERPHRIAVRPAPTIRPEATELAERS